MPGEINMKKVIIAILLLAILSTGFVLSLAWYAGLKWEGGGKILMHKDDRLIDVIEEKAFSNTYPCLSFLTGVVYHGQDTFELVKFMVNVDDSSWNVLSNRIYTSSRYISFVDFPVPFEDLSSVGEVLAGRLDMGEMSLYVTRRKNTSEQFVYLEGALIPASKIEMVVKKWCDKTSRYSTFKNQNANARP